MTKTREEARNIVKRRVMLGLKVLVVPLLVMVVLPFYVVGWFLERFDILDN